MTPDLLSTVWANPDHRPELTSFQWETILGQARRSRLLGRLAQLHSDRGWLPEVPAQPRLYLEGALRLVDRHHHELRWEIDCIRRALKDVGTPVVLLKGAAYFAGQLPPSRGRLFADIDIMVARDRLADVEGALFRCGWISQERDAYNQRYYREWMHEIPPLRHVQRGTVIDLHHTITPPTSRFKVDGATLLGGIVPIDDQRDLFVLAPTDMVLHSAVHLFQEGEFDHGLRDLLDMNDLLLHFPETDPAFWHRLFERAVELRLEQPLHHALHHLARLFETRPPSEYQEAAEKLRPRWTQRTALSFLLALALRPDHPSCDRPFSKMARWLLYVRSHYLRMPAHLVVRHLLRKAWMRRFPKNSVAM